MAELLTAVESHRHQQAVAGSLAAAGLRSGDRVAFVMGTSGRLISAALGALRTGVVPVLLNPALLPAERDALLEDCRPGLVVTDDAALDGLLAGPAAPLAEFPLARPMHYTSGTSGRPKGVWSGVLGDDEAGALFADEADLWGFTSSDTHLVCSPLHHSAPLRFAACALLRGGNVVVLPRFEPAAVADAVAEHRPTTAFMVPTHLSRLAGDASGGLLERMDLSGLRLLAHAGEACPPELKEKVLDAFPDGSVWEFYGSTEGQFTVCSTPEWRARPGTVGRARPGRRLAVDPDGTIWCRVPPFARFEYWGDPEKTDGAWRRTPDGAWFSVGDLGRLDDDGYLWVDGRRDDLVISGGVNVYPAEVEAVLAGVAGAGDVAVFGVPDPRWGRRVCAAYTGAAAEAELRRRAESLLASYKRPKDYFRVDELPRTSTGKVRRVAIAAVLGLE